MTNLGDSNLPGSGFFFDDTGNKEFWTAGQYVMPTGGGTATDINVYCAGDGSSVTGQLVIWDSGASIFWQSGNITIPSGSRSIHGQSWVHASISSVYIPAGSYEIGFWSSGFVVWTFEGVGGVNARSGIASPSNNTGPDEYGGQGFGRLGAYVVYTPLPAPNLTSVSPAVGTTGQLVTVTGTSLLHTTGVKVNGATASFTVVNDTTVTVTVPAGAAPGAGTIDVTTPAGTDSVVFTVGQVFYGDVSSVAHSIAAVKYGDPSGSGVVHTAVGIWVPTGGPPPTGVKRVW